jgi:hypothetical protein
MKRTSLAAMLTLLATISATLVVAGCGGKSSTTGSSQSTPATTPATTSSTSTTTSTPATSTHKKAAKTPGY